VSCPGKVGSGYQCEPFQIQTPNGLSSVPLGVCVEARPRFQARNANDETIR
jgi:hypothetical protein